MSGGSTWQTVLELSTFIGGLAGVVGLAVSIVSLVAANRATAAAKDVDKAVAQVHGLLNAETGAATLTGMGSDTTALISRIEAGDQAVAAYLSERVRDALVGWRSKFAPALTLGKHGQSVLDKAWRRACDCDELLRAEQVATKECRDAASDVPASLVELQGHVDVAVKALTVSYGQKGVTT